MEDKKELDACSAERDTSAEKSDNVTPDTSERIYNFLSVLEKIAIRAARSNKKRKKKEKKQKKKDKRIFKVNKKTGAHVLRKAVRQRKQKIQKPMKRYKVKKH